MKQIIFILLILIPIQVFPQSTVLRTRIYKGTEYIVFPDPQKKEFNPDIYWMEKKGKQTVLAKYPKDGHWIQYFREDTTKVAKIFQIKNGLPHGLYKRFDFDGELKEEGELYEGSRNGEWKIYNEFYKDGDYSSVGSYKAIDSAYFNLNVPYHYIKWHYGKEGSWIYINRKGDTVKREFYKNGSADGLWIDYYSDAKIKKERTYHDGELDGSYKIWNENGKLITEQIYKNGSRNGSYNEWYDNGKVKCELVYRNDSVIDGKCTLYYSTGEKYAEGRSDEDVKIGDWTYFYKNGSVWAKGAYKIFTTSMCMSAMPRDYNHSAMAGKWIYWDEKGKKVAEGSYKPEKIKVSRGSYYVGAKTGSWKYWNTDGIEIKEKGFAFKSVFELDIDKEE